MKFSTEVKVNYHKYLEDRYGEGTADELIAKSRKVKKYDRAEAEEILDYLKEGISIELARIAE